LFQAPVIPSPPVLKYKADTASVAKIPEEAFQFFFATHSDGTKYFYVYITVRVEFDLPSFSRHGDKHHNGVMTDMFENEVYVRCVQVGKEIQQLLHRGISCGSAMQRIALSSCAALPMFAAPLLSAGHNF
jgi:hypothetical protein